MKYFFLLPLRHIILLFIFGAASAALFAQSGPCYARLTDASGYTPTQQQLSELEAAACRLIDSLPSNYRDSFRVYDFGFYLHHETLTGGYPEAFQKAIDVAETQTPYYLLFGKQSDKTGIYTKFWVELRLPKEGVFECIDEAPNMRKDLVIKYKLISNNIYELFGNNYLSYHKVETGVMDSLDSYLYQLKRCCFANRQQDNQNCTNCIYNTNEMLQILENHDFNITNCAITAVVDSNLNEEFYVNRIIIYNSETINIDERIQHFVDSIELFHPNINVKYYVINLDMHCTTINQILEDIESDSAEISIICGTKGEIGTSGIFFHKIIDNSNYYVKPNGNGHIYLYNTFGTFVLKGESDKYHGIFFVEDDIINCYNSIDVQCWGKDPFPVLGESILDFGARHAVYYLSDQNMQYLKDKQKECDQKREEIGGMAWVKNDHSLQFEICTWCINDLISMKYVKEVWKYPNIDNEMFVCFWHVHPYIKDVNPDFSNYPPEESQNPSSLDRVSLRYDWRSECHGNSKKGKNTWMIPGRVGLIGGKIGVTIYKNIGYYYYPSACDTYYNSIYECDSYCSGFGNGLNGIMYKRSTNENTSTNYSYIKYNLSSIYHKN